MNITVREFTENDIDNAIEIWNEIVSDGMAFPQIEELNRESGLEFFKSQTFTGIAENEKNEMTGLYILHPNNIGRCGHISNASYAVKSTFRGKGTGEKLVTHCIHTAKEKGFGILQFNAVVCTNTPALKLYEKLGFVRLGTIPGGFRSKNNEYLDIIPHYRIL